MNPHIFKPDRTHLLAVGLMTIFALISISWAPIRLGWILIFPVLAAFWVLRSATIVNEEGIGVRYVFRGNRIISWEQFQGIAFKGSRAQAKTTDGSEYYLPGVTFNSLPELALASRGRIPDVLSSGKEAADNKVVIIHRDGHQVLLTKEECEEYQRTTPSAEE